MSRETRSNLNLRALHEFQYPNLLETVQQNNLNPSQQMADDASVALTVAPVALMQIWTENPNLGNFNPGTAAGANFFDVTFSKL